MLPALGQELGSLEAIEVATTTVAMESPIGFAAGTHARSRRAFVRICTSRAEGWGELVALEVPVGIDPSMEAALEALELRWIPRLVEASARRSDRCPGSEAVGLLGPSTAVDRVCAAALEMALLDAELRLAGRSLAGWLGTAEPSIPFGGVVGIPEDRRTDSVVEAAARELDRGAARIRSKVEPGFARPPLAALRSTWPSLALQADANGSFRTEQADELVGLDELSLACVEEPLVGRDLAATAQLARRMSTPICLDESIGSTRAAADALRYGAATVLCIKPARLGGLRAALQVHELAVAGGAGWFVGGMFEAGLGRAFLGALAARPGAPLASDVAAPSTYLVDDPCELVGPAGGRQPLWGGPGVGPWPVVRLDQRAAWSR
jgi:o-succinylbenzoate synthase